MSLIALGLCISFTTGGLVFYGAAWGAITIGWFAIAMWLWRKHVREDDAAWAERQRSERGARRTAN